LQSSEKKALKAAKVAKVVNAPIDSLLILTNLAADIVAAILEDALPNAVMLFKIAVAAERRCGRSNVLLFSKKMKLRLSAAIECDERLVCLSQFYHREVV